MGTRITETTLTTTHVEITLADQDSQDLDRQWIAFRIALDAGAGWSVATTQLKALRLAQSAIAEEIARIERLSKAICLTTSRGTA